jgi:hypothetical protein
MDYLTVVAGVVVSLAAIPSVAQDKVEKFQARTIEVMNDSAEMLYNKDYWITVVSGTVGKEGIPDVIHIGDRIAVEDRVLAVNHIFATKCLTRMEWGGQVLCEEGQTTCVAVERPEDVPSDEERDRLWIYVRECNPVN